MTEVGFAKKLFQVGDIIESPSGLVIAGTNRTLDLLPADALSRLLESVRIISIEGQTSVIRRLVVYGYSVTTSIGDQRNVFLLLGKGVNRQTIPPDGIVYLDE